MELLSEIEFETIQYKFKGKMHLQKTFLLNEIQSFANVNLNDKFITRELLSQIKSKLIQRKFKVEMHPQKNLKLCRHK